MGEGEDTGGTPTFSVVIPVFNSSDSLSELVDRLERTFADMAESYEIVLVDDGSPSVSTWPTLKRLWRERPCVHVVRLTRNFGQPAATLCGLQAARGRYVITMDDDLQHRPEDIPTLAAKREHDVVIAQFPNKRHGIIKRATSVMKGWVDRIVIGKPPGLSLTAFRLLNRVVVDGMLRISTPYPFLGGMLFYVTKDIVGVNCAHDTRRFGAGNYSALRLVRLFSNLIISNSSLLLRLVGWIGLTFSAASVVTALYYVGRKLAYDIPFPGWTSLMVTLLMIGGLMLFALGIIGEYLIRIIAGVEQKPTFFIREENAPSRLGELVAPTAERARDRVKEVV